MPDARSRHLFDQFVDLSLPKPHWDHEAHLTVCWVALSRSDPAEALVFLRDGIRRYNVATGGENTPTSGYHETLTCYFVGAVNEVGAATIDDVFVSESCRRQAPLRHWSRARLFTRTARATWTDPDLADLPWDSRRLLSGDSRALVPPPPA